MPDFIGANNKVRQSVQVIRKELSLCMNRNISELKIFQR